MLDREPENLGRHFQHYTRPSKVNGSKGVSPRMTVPILVLEKKSFFSHRKFGIFVAIGTIFLTIAVFLALYFQSNSGYDKYFIASSYDWGEFEQFHPIVSEELIKLPTGTIESFPTIQPEFPAYNSDNLEAKARRELLASRAETIKEATRRTWAAYAQYALPHDELAPLSLDWKDNYGAWGATMVDSLDALFIMSLDDEFSTAVRHTAEIDWAKERYLSFNVFETTIRFLGGLLSAYDLSGIHVLLRKAIELADMILIAFDTPNRMPPFHMDYETARSGALAAGISQDAAGAASLTLEFIRLAQITGENKYFDAVHRVTLFLRELQNGTKLPGMWPNKIDYYHGIANGSTFTLGAGADSMYEYLLKAHVLLGGTEPLYAEMYKTAADTAARTLFFQPMVPKQDGVAPSDVLLVGDATVTFPGADPNFVPEVQHLSCFAGGMYALGGRILGPSREGDVETGEMLARGCAWLYAEAVRGVMPEVVTLAPCNTPNTGSRSFGESNASVTNSSCLFNLTTWQEYGGGRVDQGPFTDVPDPQYLLRPEAVESLFVLYRATGNPEFQDMAWDMWLSIANMTATPENLFASVKDVMADEDKEVELADSLEVSVYSFFFRLCPHSLNSRGMRGRYS